ncbi:MAG: fimbrillin family protein [Bacteroides sp.]
MKKQLLAILTTTALLAGCGSDTEHSVKDNGRVALQVSGGINVQTRASNAAWTAGDQIGIYMFAAGMTTIAEGAKNIPYETKAVDGKFTPTSANIYFPVDGSNVDFHAWYPYKNVTEEGWTADLSDQRSQAALDLMTADAASSAAEGGALYNKEQPNVKLNFKHRLTKLVLNITNGSGISAADLKGLKVEITRQWKTVLYDPDFDAIGFTEEPASITLLTNTDGTSAEVILFPDNLTGKPIATGRQLVFTLNATGEVFHWDIPGGKSFNAGDKNIYNITINRTAIDVAGTITDWNKGNEGGEAGEAE